MLLIASKCAVCVCHLPSPALRDKEGCPVKQQLPLKWHCKWGYKALCSTPDTWCQSASRCSGTAPRSAVPYPCLGSGIGRSASILLLVVLDLALKLRSSCLFSWECVLK